MKYIFTVSLVGLMLLVGNAKSDVNIRIGSIGTTFKNPKKTGSVQVDLRTLYLTHIKTTYNVSSETIEHLPWILKDPLMAQISKAEENLNFLLQQMVNCAYDAEIKGDVMTCANDYTQYLLEQLQIAFDAENQKTTVKAFLVIDLFGSNHRQPDVYGIGRGFNTELIGDKIFESLGVSKITCVKGGVFSSDKCRIDLD